MDSRNAPRKKRARSAPRGFNMIEAMTALAIASTSMVGIIGLQVAAVRDISVQNHAFNCFGIAQQKIEMLSGVPPTSTMLADTTTGDIELENPDSGVDGPASADRRVNQIGDPTPAGRYQVYWKIGDGAYSTRHVRVYCEYPSFNEKRYVKLSTIVAVQ